MTAQPEPIIRHGGSESGSASWQLRATADRAQLAAIYRSSESELLE